MGNIEQWAQIEIVTFYSNILIMIVYLCRHVIFYQDSQKEERKLKIDDDEQTDSPKKEVEKGKGNKTPEKKKDSKIFNINQTIDQEEDANSDLAKPLVKKKTKVEKEDDANKDMIANAMIYVQQDADLLRTIESERQFSKM